MAFCRVCDAAKRFCVRLTALSLPHSSLYQPFMLCYASVKDCDEASLPSVDNLCTNQRPRSRLIAHKWRYKGGTRRGLDAVDVPNHECRTAKTNTLDDGIPSPASWPWELLVGSSKIRRVAEQSGWLLPSIRPDPNFSSALPHTSLPYS